MKTIKTFPTNIQFLLLKKSLYFAWASFHIEDAQLMILFAPKDKVHEWPKSALYQKFMKFGYKIDVRVLKSKCVFETCDVIIKHF